MSEKVLDITREITERLLPLVSDIRDSISREESISHRLEDMDNLLKEALSLLKDMVSRDDIIRRLDVEINERKARIDVLRMEEERLKARLDELKAKGEGNASSGKSY